MKPRSRLRLVIGLASVASIATFSSLSPAQAQAPAQDRADRTGRLLASNCFQCHGTNGKGPGFEELAGKRASKLFDEMMEYRSGEEGENIMARHARGYTEAQLRELSEWLSRQR